MDDPNTYDTKNKKKEILYKLDNVQDFPLFDFWQDNDGGQKIIKQLSGKCEEYDKKLQELDKKQKSVLSDIDLSEKGCIKTQKSLDEVMEMKKEINSEMAQLLKTIEDSEEKLKNETNNEEKIDLKGDLLKLRQQYGLYAKLFCVKWEEGAPENRVNGYVLKPNTSEVSPFSLDRESNSQYFITNHLWDQLKESRNPFMEGNAQV